MKAQPFPYQEFATNKVVELRRTAVIAPPGAGKTRPVIEGLDELGCFEKSMLIICSGPAIPAWFRQIPLWLDAPEVRDEIFVVQGNRADRMDMWQQAAQFERGIYITNFNLFYRDFGAIQATPWNTVVADEYHKVMRSHQAVNTKTGKAKTFGLFKRLTRHTPNLVLTTGSLMRRDASSMFTAFQSIAPKTFTSYWRYVNQFCFVDDTGFGKRVGGVRNAQQLRDMMDRFFAYIPSEVVADQLPEGRRLPIMVDLTKEQFSIYKDIEHEMMAEVGDTIIVTPTIFSKITRLRQLLCCPKILDPSLGMGAGYEAIVDRLDQQDHVAIFVPFRPACDYIAEDLKKKGYKNVFILRGGVDHVEQAKLTQQFRETRGIVVGTIQYAESFDLETCDTSYFLGYDLTVDQNEQAEGRTRRAISEHKFVTWNYIKTDTSIDLHFLSKLREDERNVQLVMGRPEEYIRRLKGEL